MKRTNTKKHTNVEEKNDTVAVSTMAQTNRDLVTAVLIVSLLANLFILTAWVTLQVTSAYDAQVATFLFTR